MAVSVDDVVFHDVHLAYSSQPDLTTLVRIRTGSHRRRLVLVNDPGGIKPGIVDQTRGTVLIYRQCPELKREVS